MRVSSVCSFLTYKTRAGRFLCKKKTPKITSKVKKEQKRRRATLSLIFLPGPISVLTTDDWSQYMKVPQLRGSRWSFTTNNIEIGYNAAWEILSVLVFFINLTVTARGDCGKVLCLFALNASKSLTVISVSTPLLIIFNIAPFSSFPVVLVINQTSEQYINLLFSLTGVCDLNLHTQA